MFDVFRNRARIPKHLNEETHKIVENQTTMDKVILYHTELLLKSSSEKSCSVTAPISLADSSNEEFMHGEQTGCKTIADKVVAKMRTLRNTNNSKMFKPMDYLTKQQIVSSFSRKSRLFRKGELKAPEMPQRDILEHEAPTPEACDLEVFQPGIEAGIKAGIEASIEEFVTQMRTSENIEVGSFVLVAKDYSTPHSEHSVGQVISIDDEDIEISYLVKSGKNYHWPDPIQEFIEQRENIHKILSPPEMGQREHLTFSVNDAKDIDKCRT